MNILLLYQDPDLNPVLGDMIKKDIPNCNVFTEKDPYNLENINLILWDPRKNGVKNTQKIRKRYNGPIIAFTTLPEEELEKLGLGPIDGVLTHPFEKDELLDLVRSYM